MFGIKFLKVQMLGVDIDGGMDLTMFNGYDVLMGVAELKTSWK